MPREAQGKHRCLSDKKQRLAITREHSCHEEEERLYLRRNEPNPAAHSGQLVQLFLCFPRETSNCVSLAHAPRTQVYSNFRTLQLKMLP
eukprot:XP_028339746.1 uncharacterized protein LOC114484854 isoform X2 [Physeter catodon]